MHDVIRTPPALPIACRLRYRYLQDLKARVHSVGTINDIPLRSFLGITKQSLLNLKLRVPCYDLVIIHLLLQSEL